MISYKEIPDSHIVEFNINGDVSTREYDDAVKRFKTNTHHWDDLKILEIVRDFKGIEPLALWKEVKFAACAHKDANRKLMKCAIVADKKWLSVAGRAFDPFLSAEVELFTPDQEEEARKWLGQTITTKIQ